MSIQVLQSYSTCRAPYVEPVNTRWNISCYGALLRAHGSGAFAKNQQGVWLPVEEFPPSVILRLQLACKTAMQLLAGDPAGVSVAVEEDL